MNTYKIHHGYHDKLEINIGDILIYEYPNIAGKTYIVTALDNGLIYAYDSQTNLMVKFIIRNYSNYYNIIYAWWS